MEGSLGSDPSWGMSGSCAVVSLRGALSEMNG